MSIKHIASEALRNMEEFPQNEMVIECYEREFGTDKCTTILLTIERVPKIFYEE